MLHKENSSRPQIVVPLIAVSALVVLAATIALALRDGNGPAAAGTPQPSPTGTVGAATPAPNYPSTLAAIKTNIPEVTAARQTGIFAADAGFYNQGYAMQNAWQRQVNGSWAFVDAGARIDDPDQGVIFSRWELPGVTIGRFINTPVKAGSVRVTAEQNNRLTLQATNGTLFYFDVPAQAFVSSLTEVAPTITPPSANTSTALVPTPCGSGGYPALCPTPTLASYPAPTQQATTIP